VIKFAGLSLIIVGLVVANGDESPATALGALMMIAGLAITWRSEKKR